jgi:hypothetical protein
METQAIERLNQKSEQQSLVQELQGYRLSPIESRAVYQRISRFLSEHEKTGLENGQSIIQQWRMANQRESRSTNANCFEYA